MTVSALHRCDTILPITVIDGQFVVSTFHFEYPISCGFWCRAKHVLMP
jgi:hypothetical protein